MKFDLGPSCVRACPAQGVQSCMHAKLTVSERGADRYQREIERLDSMNCSSPSRLAHSASIPVFSSRTDQEAFDLTMSSVHEPNGSPMHRSRSFETKRPVWARVEAHWARITLDHDRQSCDATLPLYQRVKSWLSPAGVPVTFQEHPVVTKVPLSEPR